MLKTENFSFIVIGLTEIGYLDNAIGFSTIKYPPGDPNFGYWPLKIISSSPSSYSAIHDGNKDYKCETCGKSFFKVGDLKRHIRTVHKGNKDYKCEYCCKSFSQASDLKRHIKRIHEGHKDYKCDSCGKSFSVADDLKTHMNIHIINKGRRD